VTESELEETRTGVADEGVDPARSIEPHNEGLERGPGTRAWCDRRRSATTELNDRCRGVRAQERGPRARWRGESTRGRTRRPVRPAGAVGPP
jgi:hypothetical protein